MTRSAIVNAIRETTHGTIVCAAGDEFPYNGGQPLNNYAAYLELDSAGNVIRTREWSNPVGYAISGFDIEETGGGGYLLSGNQAVFYLDSFARPIWQKAYTYQLNGVGSEVANVYRAKVVRGNVPIVAGKAYEGNCWTNYHKLYYDAWWSPVSYSDGSNTAWDTAGKQGGDDVVYDFTQLIDGKLVFVGVKAGNSGGIWAIVTDSGGKNLLWEKTMVLPGKDAGGFPLNNLLPLSVCAMPDSGFTLVGDNNTFGNNHNAFAMHFAPRTVSVASRAPVSPFLSQPIQPVIAGKKVIFSIKITAGSPVTVTICNAAGKIVARLAKTGAGGSPLTWDISRAGRGVYFYKAGPGSSAVSGKLVVGQ